MKLKIIYKMYISLYIKKFLDIPRISCPDFIVNNRIIFPQNNSKSLCSILYLKFLYQMDNYTHNCIEKY